MWLVLIVVGACDRSSDLEASLELAEKLIASHPDSVLTLLDSIPQSTLTTRHDQARYALLYTEALDKNHLVPTDDSLISLAVRYFEETNNMPQLMEAYYYHGRVKYHNGNFPQALLSFYKAKEMAVIVDSNFRAGMSCRGIADIYRDAYNRAEELAFAKKEYEYIKKSGKQPYLDYALYDLGVALDNNSHHKESLAFARQLIDSARLHEDSYLRYAVLQLGAISLIELGEYEEAYPMLAEICAGEYAMTDDSLHYCRVLVRKGMYGEALALLDSISDREPGVKNMIRFDIFKATGQYDKAVEEAVQADQVVDSILQSSMSHNLAGSLSEYYEMDQRIRMAELGEVRVRTLLSIIIAILVLTGVVVGSLLSYRRQRREIDRKVAFAEQLLESLNQSRSENASSIAMIRSLAAAKYELLEELTGIVICNSDTKVSRRKIADAVTRVIEDMSVGGDRIKKLEREVDRLHGNLYSDFKIDLPGLKEADYLLYLFSVLRLSNATITLFLKEDKVEAVYNRKRRLKDKIKQLSTEKKERYLQYFG